MMYFWTPEDNNLLSFSFLFYLNNARKLDPQIKMADDLNKQESKMAMIGMSVKTMSDFADLFVLHLTVTDRPPPGRTRRASFGVLSYQFCPLYAVCFNFFLFYSF